MKTKKDRLWLVELWNSDILSGRSVVTTLKGVHAIAKVQLDAKCLNIEYKTLCDLNPKADREAEGYHPCCYCDDSLHTCWSFRGRLGFA